MEASSLTETQMRIVVTLAILVGVVHGENTITLPQDTEYAVIRKYKGTSQLPNLNCDFRLGTGLDVRPNVVSCRSRLSPLEHAIA